MNILPKKRWHVRTKDNIARVRRDEAKAAEELKEVERRTKLADQEARTSFLRARAKRRLEAFQPSGEALSTDRETTTEQQGHVNFFKHLEDGESTANTNDEREAEKKKEKEDYEKKIGLLTYLGQDSQELTGESSWWQKIPLNRASVSKEEAFSELKQKQLELLDPLNEIRDHLGCEGVRKIVESSKATSSKKKKKKSMKSERRSHPSDSDSDHSKRKHKKKRKKHIRESEYKQLKMSKLEALRKERLQREKRERARTDELLYGRSTKSKSDAKSVDKMTDEELVKSQKQYNNQFNPQHARQNRLDANKKYWLE